MILIFVPQITNRASFIFEHIFTNILKAPFNLTNDYKDFTEYSEAKFSYSEQENAEVLNFPMANSILLDSHIEAQKIEFITWNNIKLFFPVKNGPLPFDPFAVAFYLLSRYEEYLPAAKDAHNRYRHQESVAFKGNFLDLPIIEILADAIKNILTNWFPQYTFPKPTFSFMPTIDIDNAYAYKHKGLLFNSAKLLSELLSFQFKNFKKRLNVLLRLEQDPFDSYEKQLAIHQTHGVKAGYFILLGNRTKYDRNLRHDNKAVQNLITKLNLHAQIGIHPSYGSNSSDRQLKKEKARLERILNKPIFHSRQHYIKLQIPKTYRFLIEAGIKEDYSMGYPSTGGFRAGTSHAFYFFDLEKNAKTELLIHPFAFMDTTMKEYQQIRSKNVLNYVEKLSKPVKKYGGQLIFIFHNESIGGKGKWQNWTNTYEDVIVELSKPESRD